jgi:sialidase-1
MFTEKRASISPWHRVALFVAGYIVGTALHAAPATLPFEQAEVFVAGTNGYHTYRIPAIVASKKGTVLAFCEGRKNGRGDTGRIDLLLKRSTDGGRSWSAQEIVWADGGNVCGNPAPVVDQTTGDIWLLMTWNRGEDGERAIGEAKGLDTRRVFVTHSSDDGLTWLKPREITDAVKKPHWRWYATGPVNGIQLTRGAHPGRLVIPANHSEHGDPLKHTSRAHVIYSDDHGQTWQLGGVEEEMTNESTVVERADGSLLHNMRSYRGNHSRAIATSQDSGLTWSTVTHDSALVEPVGQASILRYAWPNAGKPGVILFSNPASTRRENLTVRLSYDDGAAWPAGRTLYVGPSAYSCLVVLPDQMVGCLYECGTKNSYEKIVLARFPITWLTEADTK